MRFFVRLMGTRHKTATKIPWVTNKQLSLLRPILNRRHPCIPIKILTNKPILPGAKETILKPQNNPKHGITDNKHIKHSISFIYTIIIKSNELDKPTFIYNKWWDQWYYLYIVVWYVSGGGVWEYIYSFELVGGL